MLLRLKILEAMQGPHANLLYEFLAFAIDKDQTFFAGLYDESLDICEAVIKSNLSFFVERLLPRIRAGIAEIRELIAEHGAVIAEYLAAQKETEMPLITSWLM